MSQNIKLNHSLIMLNINGIKQIILKCNASSIALQFIFAASVAFDVYTRRIEFTPFQLIPAHKSFSSVVCTSVAMFQNPTYTDFACMYETCSLFMF